MLKRIAQRLARDPVDLVALGLRLESRKGPVDVLVVD